MEKENIVIELTKHKGMLSYDFIDTYDYVSEISLMDIPVIFKQVFKVDNGNCSYYPPDYLEYQKAVALKAILENMVKYCDDFILAFKDESNHPLTSFLNTYISLTRGDERQKLLDNTYKRLFKK